MSFDHLAPHYSWMERLTAGEKLQRCRLAFLGEVTHCRQALVAGEGNGKFLSAFLRANLRASVLCLDQSSKMLELAKRRVQSLPGAVERVEFQQADLMSWKSDVIGFDLIVTHFFLDCFSAPQLDRVTEQLALCSAPRALWLLADFRVPEEGWRRWRSRAILRLAYAFFKATTALEATQLTAPEPFLKRRGFVLIHRKVSEAGLLHSDLWERR